MKNKLLMGGMILFFPILISACKADQHSQMMNSQSESNENAFYPMYADENNNGINDYVEESTHWSGPVAKNILKKGSMVYDRTDSLSGHDYIDDNGNGICDYAEDGSNTWHGPGYVDENENGVCDYWDADSAKFNHHQGMQFVDLNNNGVNDYFEESTHQGEGHEFVDEDNDEICDLAQNGGVAWHGPGFTDDDHDGIHDEWQAGGRGHGGGMMGH